MTVSHISLDEPMLDEERCTLAEMAPQMLRTMLDALAEMQLDAAFIVRDVLLTEAQRAVLTEAMESAAKSARLLTLLGQT